MGSDVAVRMIRDKLKITQLELAKILGLTGTAIYNYESGKRTPKNKIIRELLNIAKKNKISITADDFIK